MKPLLIVVVLALASSACATRAGNDQINDFSKFQALEVGTTSKADIHREFGQPYDVAYSETGESTWLYYMAVMRMNPLTVIPFVGLVAGGSDADARVAQFWFDAESKYQRNTSRTKSAYVNMWTGLAQVANSNVEATRTRAEMEKLGLPFDQKQANWMKGMADVIGYGIEGVDVPKAPVAEKPPCKPNIRSSRQQNLANC